VIAPKSVIMAVAVLFRMMVEERERKKCKTKKLDKTDACAYQAAPRRAMMILEKVKENKSEEETTTGLVNASILFPRLTGLPLIITYPSHRTASHELLFITCILRPCST